MIFYKAIRYLIFETCIDTFFNLIYRNTNKLDIKGTLLDASQLREGMILSEILYINMYKFKGCRIEDIIEINLSGGNVDAANTYLLTVSWCDVEYVPDTTKKFKEMENPKELLINSFNRHSYKFTV